MKTKDENADPFHPDNVRISPEMLAEMLAKERQASVEKGSRKRRHKCKDIKFFSFPASVLQTVRIAAGPRNWGAAFNTMMAIYEIRYADYDHSQTVKLTNAVLKRHGVSRRSKRCALRILAESGQYAVEYRSERENPWITELWRPFWK